jgi:hypothetical protein
LGLLSGTVTLNGPNSNLSNSGNLSGAVQLNGANSTFVNQLSGTGSFSGGVTLNGSNGTLSNLGSLSGAVTLNGATSTFTNLGLLSGTVTLNGANGNLSNSGNLSGAVQLNGANSAFANLGTWTISGNSIFGPTSTVSNAGTLVVTGPTVIGGSLTSTFTNTGLISLGIGTAANSLTLPGNYIGGTIGMPGRLAIDVDPANGKADQLIINGNASGVTSVIATYLNTAKINNPIPFVTVGGSNTATFSLVNPLNGFFFNSITQTSAGFSLTSTLSNAAIGSIGAAPIARTATQVTIDGIETELRQRRDTLQRCAFVVSPECQSAASARGNRLSYNADDSAALGYQDENKTDRGLYMAVKAPPPPQPAVEAGPKPAVWLQAFDDWQRLNQSVAGQNDGNRQNTYGFQGGFDETWRNLFASGDALVLGLVGGYTQALVHFDTGLGANLTGPGFGGYWTYINGGFSMDGVVKNDWFHLNEDATIDSPSSSARIQNFSVTGNAQYKFAVLTNSFIEPTAGFVYTQTTFSDVPSTLDLVNGHTTRVQGGARFGTAWDYNGIHFEPTLLGLVYDNVQVTGTPLQSIGVVVPTDEGKVRGEFDGVLNADFGKGFSGFAEGDVRFGDNLLGGTVKVGLRKQW